MFGGSSVVYLSVFFTAGFYCSAGIYGTVVLSPLLYAITKSNTLVGAAEAAQGFAQLVSAIPAGWVADRYGRETVIRAAAIAGTTPPRRARVRAQQPPVR